MNIRRKHTTFWLKIYHPNPKATGFDTPYQLWIVIRKTYNFSTDLICNSWMWSLCGHLAFCQEFIILTKSGMNWKGLYHALPLPAEYSGTGTAVIVAPRLFLIFCATPCLRTQQPCTLNKMQYPCWQRC